MAVRSESANTGSGTRFSAGAKRTSSTAAILVVRSGPVKHPDNCGHCAAIRGENNPAKRAEVRRAISVAARKPEERSRRSAAVTGTANPKYSYAGSYKAAHVRVVAARGKAATYTCLCGSPAAEWSLDKARAEVVVIGPGPRGAMLPYSLNTTDYDAVCVSCHRKRDYSA